jgi:DNA-binding NarL/FixJ family response regulator
MMRVLLADDQAKVRSALGLLLGQKPGLDIVGGVEQAGDLVAQVNQKHPDLILLDWELPGSEPRELVETLRAMWPHLKMIALSGRPEARHAALSAGVDAFVSKGDPPERLMAALDRVLGDRWQRGERHA